MVAMAAIALAAIVAGNNSGNSSGDGSSGGSGGCNDKDIGGYSNGRGHRQQSTKNGRGRNGKDDYDNRRGRQHQWARTTTTARMMTARMTATMARTTGKDGEDDRRG